MRLVYVRARAGAKADMMQADALLDEALAFVFRRRATDQDARATADTVIAVFIVEHLAEPEEGQQLAIECATS